MARSSPLQTHHGRGFGTALPGQLLTMAAEEEEEEEERWKEEAGALQLPGALTAGSFPHSNPCRAWGVTQPLAAPCRIRQLPCEQREVGWESCSRRCPGLQVQSHQLQKRSPAGLGCTAASWGRRNLGQNPSGFGFFWLFSATAAQGAPGARRCFLAWARAANACGEDPRCPTRWVQCGLLHPSGSPSGRGAVKTQALERSVPGLRS